MKKLITFLLLMGFSISKACEACNLQQPKITRDLTHGTGPDNNWDWFIVGFIVLITIYTLVYSLKYLLKPGEKDKSHIKYRFIE